MVFAIITSTLCHRPQEGTRSNWLTKTRGRVSQTLCIMLEFAASVIAVKVERDLNRIEVIEQILITRQI